ncbi:MAG: response regulator [Treponema sp.]|jgi:CheY-like chemotaxis protein|nr:response regulator [Treponema sp.]
MNTRRKILIIDDETINAEFFDVMLSKLGFVVEKAENGVEGLEKVKKFFPDLILLDNVMPRMSGWELTKTLKSDPKYREIPIIMLSALDDVKDKVEGFEMGVDDYITKPFNFSEVLARIRAVLRNRELFAQIVARESRLNLAEEMSAELKGDVAQFIAGMDDLDLAIKNISPDSVGEKDLPALLDSLRKKSQVVRKHIAGLDARVERTMAEWENLKKNEIGLSVLEDQIRSSPRES